MALFSHGSGLVTELPTLAVLMALFGHISGLVTELPTLAVLMTHFGHYIAKFDGVPSELPPGGSSNGTLLTVVVMQTLAVLMALFSHAISWSANCQPWQF